MSDDVEQRRATDDPDEPRRRFLRRSERFGDGDAAEALAAVHAELLLLREENARLKSAQHQRLDINRLIGRARSLSSVEIDRDSLGDDTEQLLVDGLLIRESLLEICGEIERSMVAFEGKLNALATVTVTASRQPRPQPEPAMEHTDGYGSNVV